MSCIYRRKNLISKDLLYTGWKNRKLFGGNEKNECVYSVLIDASWGSYKIKLNQIDWQQEWSDIKEKVIRRKNHIYGGIL